ncbi:MAG: hypothetical protein AABY28_04695 [Candidatus Omnitrophota bacterium]
MNKKQLIFAWVLAVVFIMSGCMATSTKYPHIGEASLAWYAYWSKNNLEDNTIKEEYQKKIDQYLLLHPQTSKEVAEKMRNCRVMLDMSEEQVLTMAKPNRILKGWRKNKKVFRYSDVGKFGWTKFIGEGVKIRITLINGIVKDIGEVDTVLGF